MNIVAVLNREIEKGNTLVSNNLITLPMDKVENVAQREYIKEVKTGGLKNKSFEDFKTEYIKKHYINVEDLILKMLEHMEDVEKGTVTKAEDKKAEDSKADAEKALTDDEWDTLTKGILATKI